MYESSLGRTNNFLCHLRDPVSCNFGKKFEAYI
jgi:hypothetical protein